MSPRSSVPSLPLPPSTDGLLVARRGLGRLIEIGPRTSLRRLLPYALGLAVLSLVFAGCYALTPSPTYTGTHEQLGFPPCSFRAVFGLPCPGCGGTTAVCYMARGQVGKALISNLFGTVLFVAMFGAWLACLFSLVTRRPVRVWLEGPDGARIVGYTVALMLASWVLKIAHSLAFPPGVPR